MSDLKSLPHLYLFCQFINKSAADFTGPCALSLGFLFGGFNTVLGTAFCPFTGWVMVNISLGIHNHRLTVCRQSWGYQKQNY